MMKLKSIDTILCNLNNLSCCRGDSYYDGENLQCFSDKLRIIMINLRLLEPEKTGIDVEFYENVLNLMHQIAERMTSKEALIAEIDATPYDEETKKVFRWVVNVSDLNRMGERERTIYEERRKFYLDQMAVIYAEREEGLAEGLAKGLVKGREEGLEEGLLEGRAEGLAEGSTARDTFWRGILKEKGYSDAQISEMERSAGQ